MATAICTTCLVIQPLFTGHNGTFSKLNHSEFFSTSHPGSQLARPEMGSVSSFPGKWKLRDRNRSGCLQELKRLFLVSCFAVWTREFRTSKKGGRTKLTRGAKQEGAGERPSWSTPGLVTTSHISQGATHFTTPVLRAHQCLKSGTSNSQTQTLHPSKLSSSGAPNMPSSGQVLSLPPSPGASLPRQEFIRAADHRMVPFQPDLPHLK